MLFRSDEFVRDPTLLLLNSDTHQDKLQTAFQLLHAVAVRPGYAPAPIPFESAPSAVSAPRRKYVVAVFKWPLNIGLPFGRRELALEAHAAKWLNFD